MSTKAPREKNKKRERETEREGHELKGTRGTSTETDRGQGAYCAPETLKANSHSEKRSRKMRVETDGSQGESCAQKPPERRTLSNGERSEERETKRFNRKHPEQNRNGDGEVRREVANRQGDKYGNRWKARRNPLPRAHRKNTAKERELRQQIGGNKGRSTETDGKQGELGVPKVPGDKNSIEQQ